MGGLMMTCGRQNANAFACLMTKRTSEAERLYFYAKIQKPVNEGGCSDDDDDDDLCGMQNDYTFAFGNTKDHEWNRMLLLFVFYKSFKQRVEQHAVLVCIKAKKQDNTHGLQNGFTFVGGTARNE